MAALLASIDEILSQCLVEKDHRFRRQRAGLGGAKPQHIDATAPGRIRRAAIQIGHRVGETRAIHMELETFGVRNLADRTEFRRRIDRAPFARLAEAHYARLNAMDAAIEPAKALGDGCRREFSVRPSAPISLAPEKNSGAPHSDVMMWLSLWQRMAP